MKAFFSNLASGVLGGLIVLGAHWWAVVPQNGRDWAAAPATGTTNQTLIADCIRAKRIAVIDAQGRDRITLAVESSMNSARVTCLSQDGHRLCEQVGGFNDGGYFFTFELDGSGGCSVSPVSVDVPAGKNKNAMAQLTYGNLFFRENGQIVWHARD